jgi:hypothetical protein
VNSANVNPFIKQGHKRNQQAQPISKPKPTTPIHAHRTNTTPKGVVIYLQPSGCYSNHATDVAHATSGFFVSAPFFKKKKISKPSVKNHPRDTHFHFPPFSSQTHFLPPTVTWVLPHRHRRDSSPFSLKCLY